MRQRGLDEFTALAQAAKEEVMQDEQKRAAARELLEAAAQKVTDLEISEQMILRFLRAMIANTDFADASIQEKTASYNVQDAIDGGIAASAVWGRGRGSYNVWFEIIGDEWVLCYSRVPKGGNLRVRGDASRSAEPDLDIEAAAAYADEIVPEDLLDLNRRRAASQLLEGLSYRIETTRIFKAREMTRLLQHLTNNTQFNGITIQEVQERTFDNRSYGNSVVIGNFHVWFEDIDGTLVLRFMNIEKATLSMEV